MAANPNRCIRIDDETWDRVRSAAEKQGVNVADLVRDALLAYIDPKSDRSIMAKRTRELAKALESIRGQADSAIRAD